MKAALAVVAAVAVLVPTAPAAAGERMRLECDGGPTIERTNGASWWDVDDGTVWTTQYLQVREDGVVVHEKHYGRRSGDPLLCEAEHFAWRWTVHLVATG